jgi:hypothetical protein
MTRTTPPHSRAARACRWPRAIALFAWTLVSCAPAGPPRTFRFATNHDAAAALRCATQRLRVEGFEVVETNEEGAVSAVALRRVESATQVGAREWWRVEVSTSRNEDGRTVVETLAGVAPRSEGPYAEPGPRLQGVVGKISASCTW